MNKRLTLMFILAVSATVAGFALARVGRPWAASQVATQSSDPAKALCDWLGVPESQRQSILNHDPEFAADLHDLRGRQASARTALASTLERPEATDADVRAASELLIETSVDLERRITTYLLSARPHLTLEQQQRLFGLYAEAAREGRGWQWRHGRTNEAGGNGRSGRGRGAP
jgi:hypothetical protein